MKIQFGEEKQKQRSLEEKKNQKKQALWFQKGYWQTRTQMSSFSTEREFGSFLLLDNIPQLKREETL